MNRYFQNEPRHWVAVIYFLHNFTLVVSYWKVVDFLPYCTIVWLQGKVAVFICDICIINLLSLINLSQFLHTFNNINQPKLSHPDETVCGMLFLHVFIWSDKSNSLRKILKMKKCFSWSKFKFSMWSAFILLSYYWLYRNIHLNLHVCTWVVSLW